MVGQRDTDPIAANDFTASKLNAGKVGHKKQLGRPDLVLLTTLAY